MMTRPPYQYILNSKTSIIRQKFRGIVLGTAFPGIKTRTPNLSIPNMLYHKCQVAHDDLSNTAGTVCSAQKASDPANNQVAAEICKPVESACTQTIISKNATGWDCTNCCAIQHGLWHVKKRAARMIATDI